MSAKELLQQYLDKCPLIAIIRGVTPGEAEAIGDAIYESGMRIIEVFKAGEPARHGPAAMPAAIRIDTS